MPRHDEHQPVKCKAQSKRTGMRCRAWSIHGGEVCKNHGGQAPQVKAKAAQRLVVLAAERAIRGKAFSPVGNPLTALAEVAGEVTAFKDYLREQVNDLRDLSSTDDKGAEQVDALLSAYERGLDRTVSALATIAKLNIDERLARIDEAQAMMVLRAFEAGLAAVGIAGPQATTAKTAMVRQLKSVA
jgi:hypothetical protein